MDAKMRVQTDTQHMLSPIYGAARLSHRLSEASREQRTGTHSDSIGDAEAEKHRQCNTARLKVELDKRDIYKPSNDCRQGSHVSHIFCMLLLHAMVKCTGKKVCLA